MSRMTKYLKQVCILERVDRDLNGSPTLNKFGEPKYLPAMSVKCRKETYVKEVQTNTGSVLKSNTRYFFDSSVPIQVGDMMDDKVSIAVESYVNHLGLVEGYECYV